MITITQEAAEHIKKQLTKRAHSQGMRIGVKKSGCTGFMYVLDYVEEALADDHVYEGHGVKVFVDPQSLPYLDGTEVAFVKSNALNQGLEFRNPNVKSECGCGESFGV